MAGRAFRRVAVVTSTATMGTTRLWVPLLDGVERLGVAELDLPAAHSRELERDLRVLVSLIAELVVVNDAYSDVFSQLGRRKTRTVATSACWSAAGRPPRGVGGNDSGRRISRPDGRCTSWRYRPASRLSAKWPPRGAADGVGPGGHVRAGTVANAWDAGAFPATRRRGCVGGALVGPRR